MLALTPAMSLAAHMPTSGMRNAACRHRSALVVRSSSGDNGESKSAEDSVAPARLKKKPPPTPNLFDPAATISRLLTRRFGIVGGLGFVAVLALVEGNEIIQAIREDFFTEGVVGDPVTLPSGIIIRDLKVGGGKMPEKGDFVGFNASISLLNASDPSAPPRLLLDTKAAGGRPVAFKYETSRGGIVCKGVEDGVATMKRGGVREIDIPAALAFGKEGARLPNGEVVPPGSALRYVVTLEEVSPAYF